MGGPIVEHLGADAGMTQAASCAEFLQRILLRSDAERAGHMNAARFSPTEQ